MARTLIRMHPTGVFVPLITPFHDDGTVDPDSLTGLARHVLDCGAAGLVALGTTAEPATLSADERDLVVSVCADVCRQRGAPLLVAAGSNNTADSVTALQWAADLGADAALTVVPYYTRPAESGVLAHFEYLADRSPIPLIIYNVPYRTGQRFSAAGLLRLARHPSIVGVKQSVGVIDDDTMLLLGSAPSDFAVLAGEDALVAPLVAMGAPGAILACANVLPAQFVRLFERYTRGDVTGTRRLALDLVPVAQSLMSRPNPTMIKAVLFDHKMIGSPGVRLPLVPVAPDETGAAIAAVAALRPADAPGREPCGAAPR